MEGKKRIDQLRARGHVLSIQVLNLNVPTAESLGRLNFSGVGRHSYACSAPTQGRHLWQAFVRLNIFQNAH